MTTTRFAVVIMGVAGAGKSYIGAALAAKTGVTFVEGDAAHSQANRDKMAAGIPLTDTDRAPWLDALAQQLRIARESVTSIIISCSALRRVYRERLREGDPAVRFVVLHADADVLRQRLLERAPHYMRAEMLDSQLATLEMPGTHEAALSLNAAADTARIVDQIVAYLSSAPPSAPHRE
jgi:gluconokinase